jgi:hypothetical protein
MLHARKSVTTDETATVDRSITGLAACIGDTAAWQEPTGRPTNQDPEHPEEGPMTPVLLVLTFLLLLDVLVLLGRSHDSRDGRDWQPRGSPPPVPTTVALDR